MTQLVMLRQSRKARIIKVILRRISRHHLTHLHRDMVTAMLRQSLKACIIKVILHRITRHHDMVTTMLRQSRKAGCIKVILDRITGPHLTHLHHYTVSHVETVTKGRHY